MSQVYSQSHTHRNTAHASPTADEPTRNRTSEESGMQKDQHNTQSPTALLREEASVYTLETSSLCCAAAGIIAPSSSTTEAHIPHEKLREAATPNATLTAQNRPPAQLAVRYTHPPCASEHPAKLAASKVEIDERAEFEKEFPVPEGLQYCSTAHSEARTSQHQARRHPTHSPVSIMRTGPASPRGVAELGSMPHSLLSKKERPHAASSI